jgi:uncharacterized membrane protein YcaP (DUF421 family)
MFHGRCEPHERGRIMGRFSVVELSSLVVIMAIVVGVAVGSRREPMGAPFRQRPAARILLVVAVIVVALCVILMNRPGV